MSHSDNRIIFLNLLAVSVAENKEIGSVFDREGWTRRVFGPGIVSFHDGFLKAKNSDGTETIVLYKKTRWATVKAKMIWGKPVEIFTIGQHVIIHYLTTPLRIRFSYIWGEIKSKLSPHKRISATVTKDVSISSSDLEKIKQILTGDHAPLFADKFSGVSKSGRSIYLRLEPPLVIDSEVYPVLKFKGVLPRNNAIGRPKKYPSFRKRIEILGDDVFYSEQRDAPEPFGSMSEEAFNTESLFNKNQFGHVQILHGSYSQGRFFLAYAMRSDDLRWSVSGRGEFVLNNTTGELREIPGEDIQAFHKRLGSILRDLHDNGIAHGMLHSENVGINIDKGDFLPTFRDWETGKQIGGLNFREQAGWRFVDIESVVDSIVRRGGSPIDFLTGYFYDLNHQADLFSGVLGEMKTETWEVMTRGKRANLSKSFPFTIQALSFYSIGGGDVRNCAREVEEYTNRNKLIQSAS